MAYTPTEWKTGDVITAPKLNNIEQGIVGAGNVLLLRFDLETGQADKTWNEIANYMANGGIVFTTDSERVGDVVRSASTTFVPLVRRTSEGCYVYLDIPVDINNPFAKADTADGYPVVIDA